jgi:hypothetical protein
MKDSEVEPENPREHFDTYCIGGRVGGLILSA